jgi:hypothetical protein
MKKDYLNKVADKLASETIIDYEKEEIQPPFVPFSSPIPFPFFLPFFHSFSNHARDMYGLNKKEINHVWKEYIKIIKNKI